MFSHSFRRLLPFLLPLVALGALAFPSAQPSGAAPGGGKPTVVLVHGAFADASGWAGVIDRLSANGYPVLAPANPLRSLSGDADYIASVVRTIPGPVVLVGHSYGGAVITNAANAAPNVKALVYVAALAPDQGESTIGLVNSFPGSQLGPALEMRPYSNGGLEAGLDSYVKPERFHDVFAADIPADKAATMALSQRPITTAASLEASGPPAWKQIPSWFLVAKNDQTIPPDAERFMAKRARSHIVEVASSHVAMISNPGPVADLIRAAATGKR